MPNPLTGIFFVSLEAGRFLTQKFPSEKKFQMLLYPLPSGEERHVIFKGNRLLLARALQGEEDLRTSLHYLSRSFPDIHEKLHKVNLPSNQSFIQFLSDLKKPSIVLDQYPSSKFFWLRIAGLLFLLGTLLLTVFKAYQGVEYKNKASLFLSKSNELKAHPHPSGTNRR